MAPGTQRDDLTQKTAEKPAEKSVGNSGDPPEKEPKGMKPDPDDPPPKGPWGDRGVTSPKAGTKKPPQKDSSLNVRINLDLRADVALELHAVIQGDITIGLF
ncbi:hypothetical protein N7474_007968 [Penicillium riverlandense]|uniref:uncharacterized protein n=1 Tax=Penicillium riverlandense TaxID=1903569 RepID=UPI0025494525|nr:uncharacterized protein N7474_007968 [Penicillium riverlandense]KAJ5811667.1 hypothetical protein N7474_007968 [Penicillium riverlandense]